MQKMVANAEASNGQPEMQGIASDAMQIERPQVAGSTVQDRKKLSNFVREHINKASAILKKKLAAKYRSAKHIESLIGKLRTLREGREPTGMKKFSLPFAAEEWNNKYNGNGLEGLLFSVKRMSLLKWSGNKTCLSSMRQQL